MYYSSRDGLKLHVRDYSPTATTDALPIVCLSGLSRNARDFDILAKRLSSHGEVPRRVVAFDYRGRGLSAHDKNWSNYNVLTEAEDIAAGLTVLGIEHGIFVGTSRGGLVTFVLAGTRPGAIKGVVLNDIGPVIEGAGLIQIRAYLQKAPKPKTWAEAVEAQKSAMEKSFPAFGKDEWALEAKNRYSDRDGTIEADYDPNLVKTMSALDAGTRLPTAWPQFKGLTSVPMLVIRGENSSILSKETVKQMAVMHPRLQSLTIIGQGHAPMLHTAGIDQKIALFAESIDSDY